jgi:hypothetical protein
MNKQFYCPTDTCLNYITVDVYGMGDGDSITGSCDKCGNEYNVYASLTLEYDIEQKLL